MSASNPLDTTNRFWPFFSLVHTVVKRFGIIFIGVLVIVSAITVAHQKHQFRLKTSELTRLQDEQTSLDLQWQKLRLELSALAEHSRIEKLAKDKLKMKRLDKKEEVIIRDRKPK